MGHKESRRSVIGKIARGIGYGAVYTGAVLGPLSSGEIAKEIIVNTPTVKIWRRNFDRATDLGSYEHLAAPRTPHAIYNGTLSLRVTTNENGPEAKLRTSPHVTDPNGDFHNVVRSEEIDRIGPLSTLPYGPNWPRFWDLLWEADTLRLTIKNATIVKGYNAVTNEPDTGNWVMIPAVTTNANGRYIDTAMYVSLEGTADSTSISRGASIKEIRTITPLGYDLADDSHLNSNETNNLSVKAA